MSGQQVQWDEAAISQILSSPDVERELRRRAENIAKAAGPGFEVDTEQRGDRVGAMVYTATAEAMRAEHYQRALTRAIDAGRQ